MLHTILVVPGYKGSEPAHWQSWIEAQLPGSRRLTGVDWDQPVLARWAGEVRREIDEAPSTVWIVAHSFGCLASVVAIADRQDKVAGALLVAPADPERFTPLGLRDDATDATEESVAPWIPSSPLGCSSILVASRNDPWVEFDQAARFAEQWGSRCIDLGHAGHVNVESGFGPWPMGLSLLQSLQASHEDLPLGSIDASHVSHRGRQGALAKIRHWTRHAIQRQGRSQPPP